MSNPKSNLHILGRILSRCKRDGLCLIWQGPKLPDGYGLIKFRGEQVRVHRAVYEHVHGPIPEGMEIDHVRERGCWSRACCEPTHLEAVTHVENMRRAQKPCCSRGHELTDDNLSPYFLKHGRRACLICKRARNSESKRRIKLKRLQHAC